ncbi:MAG: RNA pseudouridine synthase [Candidatus Actinomarina sp.]|nr:RNA pseudouridine synthase [Candidatus Actinomarina sp.]MBL6762641.1 RNA pseudouridine synthase [Candidatus Actinomarina sp.]MBL6835696.1 RNA pseudouridine synthase [Candidatus Actinomarina sp.]
MFVILNKPHGLLVHPTNSSEEYTLRDFLIENYNISEVGEYKREGIVHRLDRVTSGLIVCPIKTESFIQLQADFQKRKIKKKYKAIVQGSLRSKSGEINLPLIHSQNNRRKREVGKNGREAITKYNTISKTDSHTLLDIDLITGRNHQIRAHFEYLKTPIVNDTLYGAKKVDELNQNTICLQSYNIEFKLFDKDYKFSINEPDYFTSIMNM